jgi:pilus assembly protein CpaB
MTLRTSLFFLIAIGCGLLAAAGVLQMRTNQISKDTATVIAVKKQIARGASVRSADVELRQVPAEVAYVGMARSLEQVVGKVATATLFAGEYVLSEKISENKMNAGIAALIPPGMRAKSVTAISPADRVSGLLDIGDRVDVILTRTVQGEKRESVEVAETLLQNVQVLAIDRFVESQSGKPVGPPSKNEQKSSSITLMVTPEEASLLSVGQREGLLSFSLRHPEDHGVVSDMDPANERQLVRLKYSEADEREEELEDSSELTEDFELEESDRNVVLSPSDAESQQSLTLDEMKERLSGTMNLNLDGTRLSTIRTIRGSRVGIVPVYSKPKK